MFKIKTLNKISQKGLKRLPPESYVCADDIENPDAVLVRSASMHDAVMGDNLLAIARAGAGVNNIPVEACGEKGIVVFNTPGANANAVKELVLAGLFLSSRKIVAGIEWARTLKGGDDVKKAVEKGKGAFAGPEISGKKLGVIGLGAIGANVANCAVALGMEVYGYDPFMSVDTAWHLSSSIKHALDIKEIFAECDYITLHVPLNDSTRNTICADTLAVMKDGVRILNFARGELVNSADIIAALESGKVASYVTDFPSDELIGVDGIIAIPHLGASTPESEENCARMAVRQLKDYLENGNIVNSVNLPSVSAPRSSACRICLIHRNIPNMLTQISGIVSAENVNIDNMLNKSRGELAYTMIDVPAAGDSVIEKLTGIDGMIKVRVIK